METALAIIQLYGITDATVNLVNHKFVIQSELAFWCSGEVCTHLNVAIDICAEYGP